MSKPATKYSFTGRHHSEATKRKISEHCGRPCTLERKEKIGNANRGEKSGLWKGNTVGYKGVHMWLSTNFGKANKCEMLGGCKKPECRRYEWALIKGKKCERKRKHFCMLCVSCHKKYDQIVKNIRQNT